MDLLITVAILGVAGYLLLRLYDRLFRKGYKETYLVQYGEKIGNDIIFHTKQYKAEKTKDGNSIKINDLNLYRPIPENDYLELTTGKDKLFTLIKIGVDRYVFRKSNVSNEVYTYKKDNEGKIIYDRNDRPILTKNSWLLCDDYVEQNVKHWERLRNREIEEKHKLKSKWAEWQPLITIGVGLLIFIIVIKFSYDIYEQHTNVMAGKMEAMISEADKMIGQLDKITGSISKTKEVEGEAPEDRQPP